ncbi:alpha/beta fold hydrolase [Mycolicibacterium goodii]|uniref:alpha/beta fold hydrolase n=1 Tax=Mycolicibacterium goodii TaxID=134601 RepID=UPI001BDC9AD2|nr:alpha/beta hydrolase [Mycolicibacterium goodii]MBU8828710.1 alpha/beta hydrolase [Mycolicibacterium goodii]ULN50651.1 alpha/beta hydrolase [Mycolicibacterium goodii]
MDVVNTGRPGRRVRLTHHVLTLDDGHEVGVSVGGIGVPMVFLHGLGLNRRAYIRLLSRVAGLGFRVVAIDAPGHGDTRDLPAEADGFTERTALVMRTMDALGIEKAVLAGHSMGGRMAIHLAAVAPDRVLAAILVDAAAGSSFDATISTVTRSPKQMLLSVLGAIYDLHKDPFHMQIGALNRYLRMVAAVAMGKSLASNGFTGAARAIMQSGASAALLTTMRENRVPTIVLHGECDAIVPFDNACDVADVADATLYRIRGACHSWLIGNPRYGADSIRQLLHGELGDVLRDAAADLDIDDWRDAEAWDRALVSTDAHVRELAGTGVVIGSDSRERVDMDLVRRPIESPAAESSSMLARASRVLSTPVGPKARTA